MKYRLLTKIRGGLLLLLPQFVFAQAPVVELHNAQKSTTNEQQKAEKQLENTVSFENSIVKDIVVEEDIVDMSAPVAVQSANESSTLSRPLVETDSADTSSELFYQLQQLQQEVLELRGIVEQQGFELRKLKQQRLDDYIDLDRRIGSLSAATRTTNNRLPPSGGISSDTGNSAPGPATSPATNSNPADITMVTNTADEQDSYDNAYGFLKQRKVDEAMAAFTTHLERFPNGDYAANALYWLGELYILKNEIDKAELQFRNLLERFPDHRKADDARFKLAKVYFQQGKLDASKELLEQLSSEDSEVSRLAKNFLQSNF
ncbi:MAG: tetratricopeptide repeat protein [Pseudomonadales bacterium]|nr:tetratricopeptide repeat protein [Pseudomonadales bacterium]